MKGSGDSIRVTAAVLSKDRKVLIARRGPGGQQPNRWEFPGGKVEPGESARQCLKRELKEEFEIVVTVGEYLGSSFYRYEFGVIELMAFRVRWKGGAMTLREHRAIRWVAAEEICDYDFSPADIPFAEKIKTGVISI